jgi:hypothetical protein
MNFKNNSYKVLRRATDEEINNFYQKGIKSGWLIDDSFIKGTYLCFYNELSKYPYKFYNPKTREYNGEAAEDSAVGSAIKDWEFKQNLSPQTLQTFNDLIDEL